MVLLRPECIVPCMTELTAFMDKPRTPHNRRSVLYDVDHQIYWYNPSTGVVVPQTLTQRRRPLRIKIQYSANTALMCVA